MEVIATQAEELECLKKCSETPLLLFPEDRKYPIIMKQNIPLKWLAHDQNAGFAGVAAPGEYYTFQIGVWAGQSDLSRVRSAPWPCSYEPT